MRRAVRFGESNAADVALPGMRTLLGLAACALVGACLHVPPIIDEDSVLTGQPSPSEPAATESDPTAPAPATVAAPEPVPVVVTRSPRACPVATGRHTFCEGRRVCSRDLDGCEKCFCNTELDSGRAGFEHADPWDMRQR